MTTISMANLNLNILLIFFFCIRYNQIQLTLINTFFFFSLKIIKSISLKPNVQYNLYEIKKKNHLVCKKKNQQQNIAISFTVSHNILN